MDDINGYLEVDFIIWNSALGVRAFVTIGNIDSKNNSAWLDEPYDMVGPFNLDELLLSGEISFAACIVMTQQRWQENKEKFQQEAYQQRSKRESELHEEINRYNKKREQFETNLEQCSQKEYRELLCLPLEEVLEISQIKAAYRSLVKKVHPDVGGSHEMFIKITQARDCLLQKED